MDEAKSLFLGKESDFSFEELFFSRTNKKGIIQSGNSVFQRVSKYEWDEIIRKPHNLIRHPAMPKGVFHLLWETILEAKPVGAYVVNRAKDGSHYWVYALVSPMEDGFLSVRLKPSSALFGTVKGLYAELLDGEKGRKISPAESQAVLLEAVEGLGFRSYHHFMTEALTQELESRQARLQLPPLQILLQLRRVLDLAADLQRHCQDIFAAHRASAFVPLNLEVQAAHIGQEAAPLEVVSAYYDGLAKEIQAETQRFMEAGNLVQAKVRECQFDVCNSLLQREMVAFFENENRPSPIQKEVEMEHLERASRAGIAAVKASLEQVVAELVRFKAIYEEVGKLATALEIVSLSGKIEAAKLKRASAELLALLAELAKFKATIKVSLARIDDIGRDLLERASRMKSGLSLAA